MAASAEATAPVATTAVTRNQRRHETTVTGLSRRRRISETRRNATWRAAGEPAATIRSFSVGVGERNPIVTKDARLHDTRRRTGVRTEYTHGRRERAVLELVLCSGGRRLHVGPRGGGRGWAQDLQVVARPRNWRRKPAGVTK